MLFLTVIVFRLLYLYVILGLCYFSDFFGVKTLRARNIYYNENIIYCQNKETPNVQYLSFLQCQL